MIKTRRMIFGALLLLARLIIATTILQSIDAGYFVSGLIYFWALFPTYNLIESIYWDFKYIRQEQKENKEKEKTQ